MSITDRKRYHGLTIPLGRIIQGGRSTAIGHGTAMRDIMGKDSHHLHHLRWKEYTGLKESILY